VKARRLLEVGLAEWQLLSHQLALDAQLIPRSQGSWPAELVGPGAHDAAGRSEVAVDQQPHADRGGVPSASGQPTEYCVARGVLVEMERLRIEPGSEGLDSLLVDPQPTRAKGLPDAEVFEKSASHAR
jgi:hypothetical protein